jgi:hypothetical protein
MILNNNYAVMKISYFQCISQIFIDYSLEIIDSL